MDNERVATAVGMSSDALVDKLDQLLAGPNDRAFVVSSYSDCNLISKKQCTIFAVLDVPRMKTRQRCDEYDISKQV